MHHNYPVLLKPVLYIFLMFLIFGGLYFSAGILMPIALAGVMAMLFLPFSRWMEHKGVNRTVSAVICVVTLLLVVAAFVFFAELAGFQSAGEYPSDRTAGHSVHKSDRKSVV